MVSSVLNGELPIEYSKAHFLNGSKIEMNENLLKSKYIISATLTLLVGMIQVKTLKFKLKLNSF